MPTRTIALIPLCVAINVVLGTAIYLLKLPIYYDAVGTIIATILLGLAPGVITGVASFLLMGALVSPVYVYFIGTQAAIALYVFVVATYLHGFKSIWRTILTGLVLGVVTGVVSAPVIIFAFGGASGSGRDLLTAAIAASGQQILKAVLFSGAASEPVDKTIQAVTAMLLIRGLPQTIRASFSTRAVAANF